MGAQVRWGWETACKVLHSAGTAAAKVEVFTELKFYGIRRFISKIPYFSVLDDFSIGIEAQ